MMDVDELESVVDAMAEECGDQIDALYDTVTLNKDTYDGFICRLREVVRLAKNEQEKSAPVGDSAALREALLKAIILLKACEWPDDAPMQDITKVMDEIEKALSAPPRNCDRFGGDIDKLREACARERGLNPEEDFPDVFPDWLLAPSTEKEGGDDGAEG